MSLIEMFPTTPHGNPINIEPLMGEIWQVLERCWEHQKSHDMNDCECLFCEESRGVEYVLLRAHTALECAVYPCPALARHRAKLACESGDEDEAEHHEQDAIAMEREAEPAPEPFYVES